MEIAGLPAHILLIHGVVVLAPLAGLAAVVFALLRRTRRYLAWPLGILALILVPLSVLTAEAGEQLEKARPVSHLIEEHAEQGGFLRFVAAFFLVVVAVQIAAAFPGLLTRVPAFRGLRGFLEARWLVPATSVLGVLAGLFLVYQSIVTGHSGAASVWAGSR
ncbi:hypothetical protein QF031_000619 [Pseudarthrobacter defluvii]|uniref:hypothetical protein n=1 Tax=Pseudarthrobacter defluvii TaxID=410837 RepID=UPI002786672D|nr:hypothetical protein [Pseudarthrobacter defluvii]MDQ0767870.1 hypothetical protein [Pseudarthrobacter defluvii]